MADSARDGEAPGVQQAVGGRLSGVPADRTAKSAGPDRLDRAARGSHTWPTWFVSSQVPCIQARIRAPHRIRQTEPALGCDRARHPPGHQLETSQAETQCRRFSLQPTGRKPSTSGRAQLFAVPFPSVSSRTDPELTPLSTQVGPKWGPSRAPPGLSLDSDRQPGSQDSQKGTGTDSLKLRSWGRMLLPTLSLHSSPHASRLWSVCVPAPW